jgi:hypothetical protein
MKRSSQIYLTIEERIEGKNRKSKEQLEKERKDREEARKKFEKEMAEQREKEAKDMKETAAVSQESPLQLKKDKREMENETRKGGKGGWIKKMFQRKSV